MRTWATGIALLTIVAIVAGLVAATDAEPLEGPPELQATRVFADLQRYLQPGDVIQVRGVQGDAVSGRVTSVTDTAIAIRTRADERQIDQREVRQIDRVTRDPVKNGVLIGLATGVVVGYALGRGLDSPSCPNAGSECGQGALIGAVNGAMLGTLGGWLVDRWIEKREPIYIAPAP